MVTVHVEHWRTKQVKVWWYEVSTTAWVWQHCPNYVMTSTVCKLVRGLACHRDQHFWHFSSVTHWGDKHKHSHFLLFHCSTNSSLLSLQEGVHNWTPFSPHTTVIACWWHTIKFFFLQQDVLCHFNCWSDLGLKCWIQVQLAMTARKRKFSPPLLKGYKSSLKIACLVFYMHLLAFVVSNILEQSSTTTILKWNPSGNPWNGTAWHLQVRRKIRATMTAEHHNMDDNVLQNTIQQWLQRKWSNFLRWEHMFLFTTGGRP